jgi:hypothetical protein
MQDQEEMLAFLQSLGEADEHALVELSAEERASWDQDDVCSRDEYREWLAERAAQGAERENHTSLIIHSADGQVLCIARKTEATRWGFLVLDGQTRLPLEALLPEE